MKHTIIYVYAALLSISLVMSGCGSSKNTEDSSENDQENVVSNDFNKMITQIDQAIANQNFALAFNVINSIPSYFDEKSQFYYRKDTGEIGDYNGTRNEKYTYKQYCSKAISLLQAESDMLLSSNDSEAEGLFLEHLADFNLGVNKVNIGKFYKYSPETEANERYQEAVTIYNDYLMTVIRKAMIKNNPDLAKKISLLIRDGLSFTPDDLDYDWKYDTEAKDEAKEIIKNFSDLSAN